MPSDTQQTRTYLRSLPMSGVYGHDLIHKLTSNQNMFKISQKLI